MNKAENQLLTIRQTQARLKADGLSVTRKALTQWMKDGQLPNLHVGQRSLLYYPRVLELLTGATATENGAREAV